MTDHNPQIPTRNDPIPWRLLKWTLFAVTIAFVGQQAWNLWNHDEIQSAPLEQIRIGWLLVSGLAYAIGWLPSVWFWHRIMNSFGGNVRFRDSARAYYCGHLGKYVPGKAMVLVIRATMMKGRGATGWGAALGATYETLVMMGTGLAVGVALAPILVHESQLTAVPGWLKTALVQPALPAIAVVIACIVVMPILSKVLSALAAKWTPAQMRAEGRTAGISVRTLAEGMGMFVVSWLLQGLSLGFTLRAVGVSEFGNSFPTDWLVWTGSTALSTSLGFAVLFAPGGLGVREGLLMAVLNHQTSIHPRQAILATVLSRLVSLITEIVAAAVLYYFVKSAIPAPTSKDAP